MKSLDIQTTGIKVIDPLAPYAAQRRGKAASADERPRRAAAQLVPRRRVEPVSARRAYLRKSWPASTSLAATHLAGFNGELMPFTLCTCAYRTHVHTFHGSLGLTLCIPDSLSLWEDVPLDCKFRVRFPSHRGVQRRATDASWITCQTGSQVFADSC